MGRWYDHCTLRFVPSCRSFIGKSARRRSVFRLRTVLRNFPKLAFRTLWKQKGTTAINIAGLAAGMCVSLLVGLIVWDQLSYDDFHPHTDRLYRVITEAEENPGWAPTPAGLAPTLRREVTGVETATRLRRTRTSLTVEGQRFPVSGYFAEPSFFQVFGFELEVSDPDTALATPGSAVLTEELAERLFGGADPIGRTFTRDDSTSYVVRGLIDRDQYQSHLQFDALFSYASLPEQEKSTLFNSYTYLRLGRERTRADFASQIGSLAERYLLSSEQVVGGTPSGFRLQAVSEIPLSDGTRLMSDNARGLAPPTVIWFLGGCALLVLLAGGFNYVNLSVARLLPRAREAGVRRALGASRPHVIGSFLIEAVLVALGAFVLSTALLQILVPAFNGLSLAYRSNLQIGIEAGPLFYGLCGLFAVGVGLFAGLYPAWRLSAAEPARVLRPGGGSNGSSGGPNWTRKVLTVLQFCVALVTLLTAALLYRQAAHIGEAEGIGFRIDSLACVDVREIPFEAFRQRAAQIPGVRRVGGASHLPLTDIRSAGVKVLAPGKADSVSARAYAVDYELIQALDLPLLAQRDWSESRFESGRAVLISETTARRLGFTPPPEAVGKLLQLNQFREIWDVRVGGLIRDIHLDFNEGRHQPVLFYHDPARFNVALVQTTGGSREELIQDLGEASNQVGGGGTPEVRPYSAIIGTDATALLQEAGRIIGFVAGLAVLISALGLVGIAAYEVRTRTREIGIRKALGATLTSLIQLLSRDVLRLIGSAVLIGVPVAWWGNQLWLRSFAYRIDVSLATFALGIMAILLIGFLALTPQIVRIAELNPAETLRNE